MDACSLGVLQGVRGGWRVEGVGGGGGWLSWVPSPYWAWVGMGGGYFVKVNYHNFQHETSKFPAVG